MCCRDWICTQPDRGCKLGLVPRPRRGRGKARSTTATERSARHDPSVSGVVLKPPDAFWTGHDIQVIRVVAVGNDHGVITAGNQDNIAIFDRHRFIDVPRICVDALENESLRRVYTL